MHFECAKDASWSRSCGLSFRCTKDVVYVSFGTNLAVLVAVSSILPECFVLASFWFKTLLSLIDRSPAKVSWISEFQKQLLFELFLCKILVIEAIKSSNGNFFLH